MDTVLFITDLHSGSRIPELAGAREVATGFGWHVEEIEVQRLKYPIKAVLNYWKPIGCILEGSSNLLPPRRSFSRLPIVHIDPNDRTHDDESIFAV